MDASTRYTTSGPFTEYVGPLVEYKDTVNRLFPTLARIHIDTWSISEVDAFALGCFLSCYPRKALVLDIGTFVGASAFFFASRPEILQVISIGPNPVIADEINDRLHASSRSKDLEALKDLKALDIAKAALAEFPEESSKIQLRTGMLVNGQMEVPNPSEGASLIAYVEEPPTREGVQSDLEAIFASNPYAIAILDNCRHALGPYVQAGVVSFMETTKQAYHFQLFGDTSSGVATSNLGLVYHDANAAEIKRTLSEFTELFSGRLDPLRLLAREEELVNIANRINAELEDTRAKLEHMNARLAQTQEQHSQAKERLEQTRERLEQTREQLTKAREDNARLVTHYSSRRYKLADNLAEGALRIPGMKRIIQRERSRHGNV
jgi:hypothetical protein